MHKFYREIEKITDEFIKQYYPDASDAYWIGDDYLGTLHVYDVVYWGFDQICRIMEHKPKPEDLYLYFKYMLRHDDIDDHPNDISLLRFLIETDTYRELLKTEVKVAELREEALAKVKATPTTFMPEF